MNSSDLGERLKAFRVEKKITGEQLANLLGITRSTVANIEAGRSHLQIKQLQIVLSQYPDLNVNWLLMNQGEMFREEATCWKLLQLEKEKAATYFSILTANNIKLN